MADILDKNGRKVGEIRWKTPYTPPSWGEMGRELIGWAVLGVFILSVWVVGHLLQSLDDASSSLKCGKINGRTICD
jgi:hypothetical protein